MLDISFCLHHAAMAKIVCDMANILRSFLLEMPNGVRQRFTKSHRFIWNYSNQNQTIDGILLQPADVKIISKN